MASYHIETSADGGPKKPTVAAVKVHCKALGLSCRRVDGEYRIAWAGDEACARLALRRRSGFQLGSLCHRCSRAHQAERIVHAPYRVRINGRRDIIASFAWKGDAILTARVVAYFHPNAYVYIEHAEGWA